MRHGFTTGSCAAAAAKAAAIMLLGGGKKDNIEITTPAGIIYKADILDIKQKDSEVSCAVRKDAGDDPDVTDKILIYAKVSYVENGKREVIIDGGIGIGRVTKKGLSQEIGAAAINDMPREMIYKEILSVMDIFDYKDSLEVIISAPEGVEIAKKTFNERLGIVGGISILGTSGIVEPMSQRAIIETIRLEMKQRKILGDNIILVTPGNYGRDFIKDNFSYDLNRAVKISNYIGLSVDMAAELGFEEFVLVGHIGKLVKVAGGIMNTHSKEADCRMEIMASAALLCGYDKKLALDILSCVSTDAALEKAKEYGADKAVMDLIFDKILANLNKRADGRIKIECMVFSNEYGILGKSERVEDRLKWK